ncbi:MAG TPA: arginase family protein [Solirubrobacteraceae bacterium]|jgi:arginase
MPPDLREPPFDVLLAPWHLDEPLDEFPVPHGARVITPVALGDRAGSLQTVADAVTQRARPLLLSADCLTALGIVAGLQRSHRDLAVVWLDGHGDFNTPTISESGYLSGMTLAMLTGHATDVLAEPLGIAPILERRTLLIDARDLDPPERAALEASAIVRTTAARADVAAALDRLGTASVYLHIDLDVVDGGELPQLRFPTPSGPGLQQVQDCLEEIVNRVNIVGACIACTFRADAIASRPSIAAIQSIAATVGAELAFDETTA